MGKIGSFLYLSVNISKTVADRPTAKVTIMTNGKSHMGFLSVDTKIDDLG